MKLVEKYEAGVDATSNQGSTPLHAASENGHLEVVKYLTAYSAKAKSTIN